MNDRQISRKILVIGSGPTTIGHGTENMRAAWKAARLVREAGHRVVVVDSCPASLALDACDVACIEPLTAEMLEQVIERERPDAIFPIAGGQQALNLCVQLSDKLRAAGVEVLGIDADAIMTVGDRARFGELVHQAGGESLSAQKAGSPEQAAAAAEQLGFPLALRPYLAAAGAGSSIAFNLEELKDFTLRAIKNSPAGATLVQKAALGWKEITCQVLRDAAGNAVVAGIIEDVDPMGVNSGDSVAVFPAQTLFEMQTRRIGELAIKLADLAGVAGSADVKVAINPQAPDEMVATEMTPCITTSSEMISFATAFSTLEAAIRLALGGSLADICPQAPQAAAIAVKVPRFSFEKFPDATRELTMSMKSVGESVALGSTFREALQKALRGPAGRRDGFGYDAADRSVAVEDLDSLRKKLARPRPERYFDIKSALEMGMGVGHIASVTGIEPLFLEEMNTLTETARRLSRHKLTPELLRQAKADGFSDAQIAKITSTTEEEIASVRAQYGVVPSYPTIGGTARYASFTAQDTPLPEGGPRIMMIAPGPNTIGSGGEFEYCVSRAAMAFKEVGYSCIAVNASIQGPSGEPELWDAIFSVPMCDEDVLEVARRIKPDGVSVQFGGPVALKLAHTLDKHGFRILGTAPENRRRCYRRELRHQLLEELGLREPKDALVATLEEARDAARRIGYPVVVRSPQPTPGKAMEAVFNENDLDAAAAAFLRLGAGELLIAEFLEDAIEVEMDAVADGESLLIGGVVEHIEEAGFHSGDSTCSFPPHTVSDPVITEMREHVQTLVSALEVRGMLNVQFAIKNDLIYVTEVLPSASLSVPFISRATGQPLVDIAAKVTAGVSLKQQGRTREKRPRGMAVRHSVFPFARFPGADAVLGPEMKSTGHVMGISSTFGPAFAKALAGAGEKLPTSGKVFVSLKNKDKRPMLFVVKKLEELGFSLIATRGTASAFARNDVAVELISKVSEGRPNIVDLIKNDEVALIINTPSRKTPSRDEVSIRASAVVHNVPIITTVSGATATVNAIEMTIKHGLRPADG